MALNILCTSVGNDGFPDVYRALKNNPENREIIITGLDIRENAPGLYISDHSQIVSRRDNENHLDQIIRIVREKKIDLLFPLSTQDQEFYAMHRQILNVPVITSALQSLKIANDKLALLEYLIQNGADEYVSRFEKVSDPSILDSLAKKMNYPDKKVVFKLNRGTGAEGLKILDPDISGIIRLMDRENRNVTLEEFLTWTKDISNWPDSHLVEYLPGDEYSVDVLSKNGKLLVCVIRKRLDSIYGLSKEAIVVDEGDLYDAAQQIVSVLGLSYISNLQFRRDELGKPKVMEINPRIPGTIGLTVESGINLPFLAVKMALNEALKIPDPTIGKKILRIWGGIYINGE